MTKQLRFIPAILTLLSFLPITAQELNQHIGHNHSNINTCSSLPLENKSEVDILTEKENSYILNFGVFHIESDHINTQNYSLASLSDIISSDEGANFNCSGGFCMNRSHFHKKGLTVNRQLFDYFLSITC